MSDLGTIGTLGPTIRRCEHASALVQARSGDALGTLGPTIRRIAPYSNPVFPRVLQLGDRSYYLGGRENVEGDSPPCLRLNTRGMFRFRWFVFGGGARSIQVYAKQPANSSPRPSITVKANRDIGVNADVTAVAGAGTGFVQVGPVTINPASDGVVWVELRANLDGMYVPCYFDNVVTA
jgi:hypothetical protein